MKTDDFSKRFKESVTKKSPRERRQSDSRSRIPGCDEEKTGTAANDRYPIKRDARRSCESRTKKKNMIVCIINVGRSGILITFFSLC